MVEGVVPKNPNITHTLSKNADEPFKKPTVGPGQKPATPAMAEVLRTGKTVVKGKLRSS